MVVSLRRGNLVFDTLEASISGEHHQPQQTMITVSKGIGNPSECLSEKGSLLLSSLIAYLL